MLRRRQRSQPDDEGRRRGRHVASTTSSIYLKGEFLDAVYLQQDAFDEVDAATTGRPAAVRVRT